MSPWHGVALGVDGMGFGMFFHIITIATIQRGELGEDVTVFVSCAFDGRTVQGDAAHEDGIDAQFVQAQAFADNGAHEK